MNCPHCSKTIPDGAQTCNDCGLSWNAKLRKRRGAGLVLALFAVLGIYLLTSQSVGCIKGTSRVLAAVTRGPIVIDDKTYNLDSPSWKVVPLNAPYSGTLVISAQVVRGNALDISLLDANQMDKLQICFGPDATCRFDFAIVKTTAYLRTAQVQRGNSYLVFRDTSVGKLSSQETDVKVSVTLNP
jgi:predicted nucleic acid-binding Zn ribbon protein